MFACNKIFLLFWIGRRHDALAGRACRPRTSFPSIYARCDDPNRSRPSRPEVRPSPTPQDSSRAPWTAQSGSAKNDRGSQTDEHGRPMSRLNARCDSFLMGCPSNRHAPVSFPGYGRRHRASDDLAIHHTTFVRSGAQNAADKCDPRRSCCRAAVFRCALKTAGLSVFAWTICFYTTRPCNDSTLLRRCYYYC